MGADVEQDKQRDLEWAGHLWQIVEMPLADGGVWRHAEPSAQTAVAGGVLELRVERFERSHDTVQILDNPKHLLLSPTMFAKPRVGEWVFSVQMAVENIGGSPFDYRASRFHADSVRGLCRI